MYFHAIYIFFVFGTCTLEFLYLKFGKTMKKPPTFGGIKF